MVVEGRVTRGKGKDKTSGLNPRTGDASVTHSTGVADSMRSPQRDSWGKEGGRSDPLESCLHYS